MIAFHYQLLLILFLIYVQIGCVSLRRRKNLGFDKDHTFDGDRIAAENHKEREAHFSEPPQIYPENGNKFGKVYSRRPRQNDVSPNELPSKKRRRNQDDDSSRRKKPKLTTEIPSFPIRLTKSKIRDLPEAERKAYYKQYSRAYYYKRKQQSHSGTKEEREKAKVFFKQKQDYRKTFYKNLKQKVLNNLASPEEIKRFEDRKEKQRFYSRQARMRNPQKSYEWSEKYRKKNLEKYKVYYRTYAKTRREAKKKLP